MLSVYLIDRKCQFVEIFRGMKSTIAIFLMICLQVAISPFCLCFGAEVSEEVAVATCCHAPEGTEPAPCPHCDQELPISATAPVKGDFDADPPEWNGFTLFFGIDLFDALKAEPVDVAPDWVVSDSDSPPFSFPETYGVFLI